MSINLDRFVIAQEHVYEQAKRELENGCKSSHWMWFVFPQVIGLGRSSKANYYGIQFLEEAKAYLEHPVLGNRLKECCQILLKLEKQSAQEIFGYTDALKLRSSMTLFAIASEDPIFLKVLHAYYNGEHDQRTREIVKDMIDINSLGTQIRLF